MRHLWSRLTIIHTADEEVRRRASNLATSAIGAFIVAFSFYMPIPGNPQSTLTVGVTLSQAACLGALFLTRRGA